MQQVSNGSKINLFADDIALYNMIIYTSKGLDNLQFEINAVSSCFASKYLSLNANKCCYLLLYCKRSRSISLLNLTLGDVPLDQVNSYMYVPCIACSLLQISCGPRMSQIHVFVTRPDGWLV